MTDTILNLIKRADSIPGWIVPLIARISIAGLFFKSGLTKVVFDGGIQFSSSVQFLFEQEYNLPLLPWDVAAFLATSAELLIPPLLVLGLATRLSALALLGMTAVIQIFVYPAAWDTHLMWATVLILLISKGPGCISLDHVIRKKVGR